MSGKKPKLATRWKFPDGTTEEVPVADLEAARIRQAAAMAEMDHPGLKEAGEAKLRELAERLTKQAEKAIQPRMASKKPRPKRRNPLRAKIIGTMRKARRRGVSFANHLDAWLTDEQDRLLLELTDDGRYLVTDDKTGDETTYARSTLEKLWNNAG